jgi:hypothetical protein
MNVKKLIITIVAFIIIGVGGTTVVVSQLADDKKKDSKTSSQQQTNPATNKPPTESDTYVTYDGQAGKTALVLLKEKNSTVVTKDSDYGPYVDSINGIAGGTGGKYWAFYVNGKLASVGADAYETKAGDKIEWKFE